MNEQVSNSVFLAEQVKQEEHPGYMLEEKSYLAFKHAVDFLISLCALILLMPLGLLVAIFIKLTSPSGSVIFVQERVGRYCQPFSMYKFRTMHNDSEQHGPQFAIKADPRVIPFGSFLRKFRIDELPQFINVLKGQMSIIGPRPEQVAFVSKFKEEIPRYSIAI